MESRLLNSVPDHTQGLHSNSTLSKSSQESDGPECRGHGWHPSIQLNLAVTQAPELMLYTLTRASPLSVPQLTMGVTPKLLPESKPRNLKERAFPASQLSP